MEEKRDLLTPKQAAEYAQVHLHTLNEWVKQGKVRYVRRGRIVRILRESLLLGTDEESRKPSEDL